MKVIIIENSEEKKKRETIEKLEKEGHKIIYVSCEEDASKFLNEKP
jgi:hypothetical protein